MALTTTPCHPDADSYISLTEADSYVTNNVFSSGAWATASDANKELGLRAATKIIDKLRIKNSFLYTTQQLKFPQKTTDTLSGSGGMTTTTITDTANLQSKQDYPEDWWKYGAVRNSTETSTAYWVLSEISASSFANGTVTFATMTGVSASDEWLLIGKVPDDIRWATVEVAMWILDGNNVRSNTAGVKSEKIGDYAVSYSSGSSYSFVDLPETARDYLMSYIQLTGNIT